MAEIIAVLGAVASVAQLADYASKLSVKLYSYAASVQRADKTLGSLANEVSLASVVLKELWVVLEEERETCWGPESEIDRSKNGATQGSNPQNKDAAYQNGARKSYVSAKAMQAIEGTVAECMSVFEELSAEAEKGLGVKLLEMAGQEDRADTKRSSSKMSTFNKMKYPFRAPKFDLLRSQLDRLKCSLTLMLQILTFARDYTTQKQDSANLVLQKQMIEQLSKSEYTLRQKYAALKKRLEFATSIPPTGVTTTTTTITATTTHTPRSRESDKSRPPTYEDAISNPSSPALSASSPGLLAVPPTHMLHALPEKKKKPKPTWSGPQLGELLLCFNLVSALIHDTRPLRDQVIFSNEQHTAHDQLHKMAVQAKYLELQRLSKTNQSTLMALAEFESEHTEKMRHVIEELVQEMWEKYPIEPTPLENPTVDESLIMKTPLANPFRTTSADSSLSLELPSAIQKPSMAVPPMAPAAMPAFRFSTSAANLNPSSSKGADRLNPSQPIATMQPKPPTQELPRLVMGSDSRSPKYSRSSSAMLNMNKTNQSSRNYGSNEASSQRAIGEDEDSAAFSFTFNSWNEPQYERDNLCDVDAESETQGIDLSTLSNARLESEVAYVFDRNSLDDSNNLETRQPSIMRSRTTIDEKGSRAIREDKNIGNSELEDVWPSPFDDEECDIPSPMELATRSYSQDISESQVRSYPAKSDGDIARHQNNAAIQEEARHRLADEKIAIAEGNMAMLDVDAGKRSKRGWLTAAFLTKRKREAEEKRLAQRQAEEKTLTQRQAREKTLTQRQAREKTPTQRQVREKLLAQQQVKAKKRPAQQDNVFPRTVAQSLQDRQGRKVSEERLKEKELERDRERDLSLSLLAKYREKFGDIDEEENEPAHLSKEGDGKPQDWNDMARDLLSEWTTLDDGEINEMMLTGDSKR